MHGTWLLEQIREWLAVRAITANAVAEIAAGTADRRTNCPSPRTRIRANGLDVPPALQAGRLAVCRGMPKPGAFADAVTLGAVHTRSAGPEGRNALGGGFAANQQPPDQRRCRREYSTPAPRDVDTFREGIEVLILHTGTLPPTMRRQFKTRNHTNC